MDIKNSATHQIEIAIAFIFLYFKPVKRLLKYKKTTMRKTSLLFSEQIQENVPL